LKKIWIGGLVVLVLVLVVFRQRLYLRDPIARVERNGSKQAGMRVYLNYYNDIIVEDVARNQRYLVQAENGMPLVPGVPLHLGCLRAMACLTDRNFASTRSLGGAGYDGQVVMTNTFITLTDGDGAAIRVTLR
jgi:hypothetical protein